MKQIRTLLTTLANDNADERTKELVNKILTDDSSQVGFVINERYTLHPKHQITLKKSSVGNKC